MRLLYAAPGQEVRVKSVGGDAEVRRHLMDLGFSAGASVTVIQNSDAGLIVQVNGSRMTLDRGMASQVAVSLPARRVTAADVALVALSLLLCLGTAFVFHPCGPKDDGSWMRCHWAGVAVAGAGGALAVAAVLRACIADRRVKRGMGLASLPFILFAALVPGVLIPLCGMKAMRCHTVMRPAVAVVCAVLLAVTAADAAFSYRSAERPA